MLEKIFEADWKRWVVGGAVGGAIGFATGYFLKGPVLEWKEKHGIDSAHLLHHADLGGTIAVLGAMAGSHTPMAPYIAGFGVGLSAEDWSDQMGFRVGRGPEVYGAEDIEVAKEARTEWRVIPDWPPRARYAAMCNAIRQIVYEDAHDPAIREQAEDIIKEAELDGRDYEAILMAFQLWILNNTTYVHDQTRGPEGGAHDRYAHAYITMPASEKNPRGRGVGDCDDLAILFLSLAMSVGINGVCGILVDQTGRGYSHIMGGYCPTGRPKSIHDVVAIELTEHRPFGWVPNAKRYGFLLL